MADITVLTEDGGNISWSWNHGLVLFDRMAADGYFDIWVMNWNGTNQRIMIPAVYTYRHIGNATWHPTGNYLAYQLQHVLTPASFVDICTPGSGILNDIYILKSDVTKTWPLVEVSKRWGDDAEGVLNPTFNNAGDKIAWGQRVSAKGGYSGEWHLHVADFSYDSDKGGTVTNDTIYNPGCGCNLFEPHSFSPDDRYLLFSSDKDGHITIYEFDLETERTTKLLDHGLLEWDEHAHYSPDGTKIVYMSSHGLTYTYSPFRLDTEFWICDRDGSNETRLTYMHDSTHAHYMNKATVIAADSEWNSTGLAIIGMVINNLPKSGKRGVSSIILITDI